MPVAYLTLALRMEWAQSLKDRRQVVRSVRDGLRHAFNISVAELDETPVYGAATLGVAAVSASRPYLAGQMEAVEAAAARMAQHAGAELAEANWDWLETPEAELP